MIESETLDGKISFDVVSTLKRCHVSTGYWYVENRTLNLET